MRHLNCIAAVVMLMVTFACPAALHADGRYRILVDEGGAYLQTENDGEWYIPEEDQHYFAPGQSGHYRIGRDANGRYLEMEQGKFYVGESPQETDIEAFNRTQREARGVSTESEVVIVGEHVIVPVQIKYKGRSLDVNLLLDTGASIIILHKEAVERLRLPKGDTAHFTTAGGHVITANMVELEEVRFGPHHRSPILAGIIEHKRGGSAYFDGLLGMNALRGLEYRIDFDRQTVRWLAPTSQ